MHARFSRRSLLAVLPIGFCAPRAFAKDRPCRAPVVLFVCPAGTVKSPIARELLKRRARDAGVPVDVRARGVVVEDHVSPALARRLAQQGIDLATEPPRPLAPGDVAEADIVIAFDGSATAPGLASARAWRTPSWNTEYTDALADLDGRLEGLLDELRARAVACGGKRR